MTDFDQARDRKSVNGIQHQLHLAIELRDEQTLKEYLPGPNAEALAAVTATAAGTGEPFIFLFGAPRTGKTHLLQAACLAAWEHRARASFIPLATPGLEPRLLDDLERQSLVALDDIQAVAGQAEWELALFALFNRLRECGRSLIIAADAAPDALPIGLPDLRSRLQWGPPYCLLPLDDADTAKLILDSAQRRGLQLGDEVVRFIMTHHARDPASLLALIARVDSLSLREQRRPTIPLVRRAMQDCAQSL